MNEINYKILLVDENEEQIDDFKTFIESLSGNISVVGISSIKCENDLWDIVIQEEIDAVAFDYKLKENDSTFLQNGDAYQNQLLENFENFPTFIITNNAADSKTMKSDPFKIIDKGIIYYNAENATETAVGRNLIEKIKQSIDTYRENIASYEDELYTLIERQASGAQLSENDLNRMIDLDTKLENSISKKSRIPKEWKSPASIQEIISLVSLSSEILTDLKKLNEQDHE